MAQLNPPERYPADGRLINMYVNFVQEARRTRSPEGVQYNELYGNVDEHAIAQQIDNRLRQVFRDDPQAEARLYMREYTLTDLLHPRPNEEFFVVQAFYNDFVRGFLALDSIPDPDIDQPHLFCINKF